VTIGAWASLSDVTISSPSLPGEGGGDCHVGWLGRAPRGSAECSWRRRADRGFGRGRTRTGMRVSSRMARIGRWDEVAFADARDEVPTFLCLEPVMVWAKAIHEVEHGEVRLAPVDPVVVLEGGPLRTSLDGA
jgi:hypothetical protein